MKQFCCGDVVPGCKATFRETTEEGILNAVARHARQDHGMFEIPVRLVTEVRKHITQVAAA